ncbi:MAG: tRNA (uridine(34)/cytosine(34)/5-carboxymethylaminomethyluridine(34)-2'-O)-methyltransferase TrmL [Halobacteriovoraceae bacterium]|jgi:tRNA (cytidine/uridine-2'-O-)-methyltransferase|nr:tRNA (uridine(34)/cytosine(34)/5-carboxymethylaminomethyluridine(34)-2'-O)-methyltransferase TrmL [Halobacteriovoraceae bacterium]MBC99061.1 tRNA (uridine(34)/cytosine(34)/5-carboxymethylaminomethyluridine(34)-2'-O)-methyltransferase TrmL [Halobacteriovoraceae bacterium]|tara:strand:- start:115916 stop:116416 length:501 start_codon:yes stop_codon:yes gene_type:complete
MTIKHQGDAQHPLFHIVLVEPEIPGNTGSIGRTCLALGAHLHLIHPLGFDINEKAVRRAGLDYWQHIKLFEYSHFEEFLEKVNPSQKIFFSAKSYKEESQVYYQAPYQENCALIFGKESTGLGDDFLEKYKAQTYHLPMDRTHIRSLNLASVVTTAGYEAFRHLQK